MEQVVRLLLLHRPYFYHITLFAIPFALPFWFKTRPQPYHDSATSASPCRASCISEVNGHYYSSSTGTRITASKTIIWGSDNIFPYQVIASLLLFSSGNTAQHFFFILIGCIRATRGKHDSTKFQPTQIDCQWRSVSIFWRISRRFYFFVVSTCANFV